MKHGTVLIGRRQIGKEKFISVSSEGIKNITPFRPRNSDRILLATSNGLAYLDSKTDKMYPFPTDRKALNSAAVRYIFENKKGVWCVSNQGVFLVNLQGKVLQELSVKTGFPTNDFYHLHEDEDGTFWLGTADVGLLAWHPKTNEINVFGQEQGFLNENIYAVYEDDYGFLWLPSDYGLVRFNKETEEVNTFLKEHGLPSNEFNTYSHYQDSLGNLYFGGINGIVAFHPKEFVKNTAVNIPLHLTAFRVMSGGQ
ncbi:MAG: hypothetical protein HC803_11300 [Saprospiraceae bacterium]|nr:hypothetical protein [Saprospiraceae bacterium]